MRSCTRPFEATIDRLVHVERLARAAGHPATRLADEQRARRHVPRVRLPLPVGVEAAGGDVREREAGAEHGHAPHLPPDACHARAHLRDPARGRPRARARRRSVPSLPCATRDPAPAVQPGAAAPLGDEQLPQPREQHHAHLEPAPPLEGDRHAERGQARHEGDGAVERVDDPAAVGAGRDRAALLAEEADGRKPPAEEPPDDPLRRSVRARHGISRPLQPDRARPAEPRSRIRPAARAARDRRRGSPGSASCRRGAA